MRLLFLVPLMLGLVVSYIFNDSADETAEIVGLVTAAGLALSLVLAPWQLQILVLMLALVSIRRLLQVQYKVEPKEKKEWDESKNRPEN